MALRRSVAVPQRAISGFHGHKAVKTFIAAFQRSEFTGPQRAKGGAENPVPVPNPAERSDSRTPAPGADHEEVMLGDADALLWQRSRSVAALPSSRAAR